MWTGVHVKELFYVLMRTRSMGDGATSYEGVLSREYTVNL